MSDWATVFSIHSNKKLGGPRGLFSDLQLFSLKCHVGCAETRISNLCAIKGYSIIGIFDVRNNEKAQSRKGASYKYNTRTVSCLVVQYSWKHRLHSKCNK